MNKKLPKKKSPRLTHSTVPATVGLVKEVRSELRAEIRGVRSEMKSGFAKMESRFAAIDSQFALIDSKFASMDSKFASMESRFDSMESRFAKFEASIHRSEVLLEEQRGENRIVLDGLRTVLDRQDRIEEAYRREFPKTSL